MVSASGSSANSVERERVVSRLLKKANDLIDIQISAIGATGAVAETTMNQPTILIVEDSALNRKLVETVLKPHGYRVVAAENGQAGVDIALREKPDLILMDVMMPVMNGYDATQLIKSNHDTARIPIIALTASAIPHERDRALAAGCDGYISKPIDTRAFPGQIKQFFDGTCE